eukprot:TRINITY_DN73186_c0_g1_i1.p1 TRINITY_DN73186_c0_g1~~TRINITY_DN73186_c0_g1_i1.p1  ORF type:complete len:854 (-),score=78.13 TRINITY_DN73186_c0_g1_i1:25-2409(-)
MVKFYNDTYSANGMVLCVFGKEGVTELEEMVRQKFGSVPNKGVTMPVGDDVSSNPPFIKKDWNRLLLQNPVKDIRLLTFSWVIPYQAPHWRTKPTRYISHLLGHEGVGSIIAVLKEQGLIASCSVGNGAWLEGAFSLLNVTFELTEKGVDNVSTIGHHLFAYLGMLQKLPPEKRIYDEMAKLAEMQFKFGEDGQPFDMCPGIALGMVQGLPPTEALAGHSLLYDYDPQSISSLLRSLTLDGVRVSLQAKSLAERCTDRDTSYESPMKFEPIEAEDRRRWSEALGDESRPADEAVNIASSLGLHLPAPNPFIAEDLSLRPLLAGGSPKLPVDLPVDKLSPVSRIFHRQDDEFLQPKARITFMIYTDYPSESVENWVCSEIWCRAVHESLMDYSYDALVAGVSYSLKLESGAIKLVFGGFNDKLPVLMDAVIEKMRTMIEVPENIFSIVSDSYGNEIKNQAFRSQPYMQCSMRFNELSTKGFAVPAYKKCEAFEQLNRERLNGIVTNMFDTTNVEVMALGNLLPEEVHDLTHKLIKGLGLSKPMAALPERAEAVLPSGSTLWSLPSTDEDSPNHAVFARIQLQDSIENDVMMSLLGAILSSKFFDTLRTQQQLGYIVGMQHGRSAKFCYLYAVVQTEFPPDFVRGRIDAFLDEHLQMVENHVTEEEFEICRQGVLSQLKTKPKNLREEMGRFSGAFGSRAYDFDRIDRTISFLEQDTCSLQALRAFTRDRLAAAPRMYNQVVKVLARDDKMPPEGVSTPPDAASLRKWTTHVDVVDEFSKSAVWLPLNNEVRIEDV